MNNLKIIQEMFALQTRLYSNVLADFNEEVAQTNIGESSNHIAWLAGHIVSSRHGLCNVLGGDIREPFPEYFEKGKGVQELKYPTLKELTNGWKDISKRLEELLQNITEKRILEEAPFKVPMGDGSIGSVIGFYAHHEAYHIGQLGLARRYHGQAAMKYN